MKREILSFHPLSEEELRRLCPPPSALEQGFYRMKFDRKPKPEPSAKPESSAMEQGYYRMKFDRKPKPESSAKAEPSTRLQKAAFPEPQAGDVLPFGGYRWCVLERRGDVLRVIAQESVAQRPYDRMRFGTVEWRSSELRSWLNGEFFGAFTPAQQAAVLTSRMQWRSGLLRSQQDESLDRVCLLTAADAQRYLDNSILPPCGGWWWLIDTVHSNVSVVDQKHRVKKQHMSYRKNGGVRPVLYLSAAAYQRLRMDGGC